MTKKTIISLGKCSGKRELLVERERKLARLLSANNKTIRDRALKRLKEWMAIRSTILAYGHEDMLCIWEGLFNYMWMSDKPLVQEETAENISLLLHFPKLDASMLFFQCGLVVLMDKWFGIDQLRLDKFLMLVRRLLRQALVVLRNNKWCKKGSKLFSQAISTTVVDSQATPPLGLLLHFTEVYLEELSKVANGKLNPEVLTEILRPFIRKLAQANDGRVIGQIRKHVFTYLIRQSDLGMEYQEKYNAWRQQGFPGSIKSAQKIVVRTEREDLEETAGKPKQLDPRAGRVDVELPQLKFHAKVIAQELMDIRFEKGTNTKSRKMLTILAEQFKQLAQGVYPLGVKKAVRRRFGDDTNIRKAVNRLVKFDEKIMGKKAKRKRKLEPEVHMMESEETGRKNKVARLEEAEETIVKPKLQKVGLDTHQKKKVKRKKKSEFDCVYSLNSGTWFVSNIDSTTTLPKTTPTPSPPPQKKVNDLKSPFSKKVKINTRLNQSQEMHEHHAQILSSPALPFDAAKKPVKPVLKQTTMNSPINPFYRFRSGKLF